MNKNLDKNHYSDFESLNQLIAAQSMFHIFPEETKQCEFIVQSLMEISAIKGCAICLRNSTIVKGIPELEVATIMEYLKNIPEEQDHFSISLPEKENRHIFSIETLDCSFGYVYISLKDSGGFDIFKPAINNFINMIAMDLENRWQKQQLVNHKFHLEELVEKRTAELKKEISERVQAEEKLHKSENKFRLIANYTFDWEYWIDKNGDYVYISPSCERITGYTVEEFISKPDILFEMVHPDFREKVHTHYQNKDKGNPPVYTTQFPIINRKGDVVWLEHNCSPIFDKAGKYLGNRGNNRDITVRKKAEEDLIKALEKANESDRLKSAFLTNMSHEIRTPMNGILGFSNLLKEPGLSGDEQKEYINIIEKSGTRMLNTINDIIDISRIESGQIDVTISEVNINDKIEYLNTFFKPEAEEKGIQISSRNGLPKENSFVKTDREKFYSILTNLIKNALKYSHGGSIEFGYIYKKVRDPCELEFYVKDTGIGIPKERLEAIFDRFVQADIEDKEVYEGSGLGLAISKAYVEMLGGTIRVESEVGVGSQFYFTIPYNTSKNETSESKDAKSKIKSEIQIKKLKILIADDEETAKLYLTLVLSKINKEFLIARTGVEAVEICHNNPDIDLILMDIRMPVMNGDEATRKIRQFNKDVIIIAQTAYGLLGDREKTIEAGCNDYISKPIRKNVLIEMIGKYFNR